MPSGARPEQRPLALRHVLSRKLQRGRGRYLRAVPSGQRRARPRRRGVHAVRRGVLRAGSYDLRSLRRRQGLRGRLHDMRLELLGRSRRAARIAELHPVRRGLRAQRGAVEVRDLRGGHVRRREHVGVPRLRRGAGGDEGRRGVRGLPRTRGPRQQHGAEPLRPVPGRAPRRRGRERVRSMRRGHGSDEGRWGVRGLPREGGARCERRSQPLLAVPGRTLRRPERERVHSMRGQRRRRRGLALRRVRDVRSGACARFGAQELRHLRRRIVRASRGAALPRVWRAGGRAEGCCQMHGVRGWQRAVV